MIKIDVLISTYNGKNYLIEQLDSLLNQTVEDFRVLIRDDGSQDNTIKIIKEYAIKYYNKICLVEDGFGNLGSSSSFMKLLEYSDSDYIMFCDQDDVWLPNKIELTMNKMREMEKLTVNEPCLVFSDLKVVDSKLKTISNSFWLHQKIDPKTSYNWKNIAVQNIITGCTIMINKHSKKYCLPFDLSFLLHDQWLGITIAKSGKIDFIYDKTILYRQHNNNVAGAQNYGLMYLLTKFKDFLTIMKYFRFLSKYFSELSFFELLYIKIKINFVRLFNLTTY